MPMLPWTIELSGMKCDGCVSSVTQTLEATPGVEDVAVSLNDQQAHFMSAEENPAIDQALDQIRERGFRVVAVY